MPKVLAERFDLKAGSQIKIVEERGGFVVKPITKRTFTLRELVDGITP